MVLHVNQIILGAVQEGECSKLDDENPYKQNDVERYEGWKQGHKRIIQDHKQQERYANSSAWQKILCFFGVHKYNLQRIPGRPHIDCGTGLILRRDPVIEKYTCLCCGKTYFINLDGGEQERKRRLREFRKQRQSR